MIWGKLICMTCKQSLLSYHITPNGTENMGVGSISNISVSLPGLHKCDGSLRNGPKSDPI